MPSQVELAAQGIAEVLAPAPTSQQPQWRWCDVHANNGDGTLSVLVGSSDPSDAITVQATTAAAGAPTSSRVRVMFQGSMAVADAVLATLGATETVYNTGGVTVLKTGNVIEVRVRGVTASPSSSTVIASGACSSCKPDENTSGVAVNDSTSTHKSARIWVNATNGNVGLAATGTTSSETWYGTLTYIIK